MTAAKVMGVIARQPDCAGQAADAVSAYTQVKLEDAPRSLKKKSKVCMSRRMDTSSTTQVAQNHGQTLKTQWHLQNEFCMDPPSAGLLWDYRVGNVRLFIESKDYSCRKTRDDIKMTGRKQNMAPMWKKLMKKRWSLLLRGLATLVVVEGAKYLSGFALDGEAKSQPRVTVAGGPGGPIGYGRGPPTRAHERRVSDFHCTTFLLCLPEGPEQTQPRYTVIIRGWWSP